jgi:hypothetical protein
MRFCVDCDRELVKQATWATWSRQERADRSPVQALSRARGLCATCWTRASRAGTLIDYEQTRRPVADVMEEWWEFYDPMLTLKDNVNLLAPRFDMTPSALKRAVYRARQLDQAA